MVRVIWIFVGALIMLFGIWGCDTSTNPTPEEEGGPGPGPFPSLGGNWEWQYPLPQGNDLLAVDFADYLTGVAVGYGGVIVRTDDAGETWTGVPSVTNATLYDIRFSDEETAWVVGSDPWADQTVILKSEDAGQSWSCSELSFTGSGKVIAPANNNVVFAAGETPGATAFMIRTVDGGTNWELLNTDINSPILSLWFTSSEVGFAGCENGRIYGTLNGGDDWGLVSETDGNPITSIAFWGNNQGWAVTGYDYPNIIEDNQIFKSTDGGEHWTPVDLNLRVSLYSVTAPDYYVVLAVGFVHDPGQPTVPVMISSSGGSSSWGLTVFNSLTSTDVLWISDISWYWMVGPSNFIGYYDIFWQEVIPQSQISHTDYQLFDVDFVSDNMGWAVGSISGDSALVLFTGNGGQDWTKKSLSIPYSFQAVSFTDASHGWAASDGGIILRTTSGGNTWQDQITGTTNDLNDIYFRDTNAGWCVGDNGTLLQTTNGDVWSLVDLGGIPEHLFCIEFATDQVGYIGGEDGTLIVTLDGGLNWSTLDDVPGEDIVTMCFVNADSGWAGTHAGQVLRTYNGGTDFAILAHLGTGMINDIEFVSPVYGFICGPDGRIYHSCDYGNSWFLEYSGTDKSLHQLYFPDDQEGWAVGDDGAILHWER